MKTQLLFFIYFWLFSFYVNAQQYPLFTNYVLNDFGFNPAIAGTTDYLDMRMTYRSQWTGVEGAPQTQIMSAQSALKTVPLGVGGYIYNDIAGLFKRTGISAAVSHGLELGFGKLNIGVSGSFYTFQLASNQLAEMEDDPTLANGLNNKWLPDMNAGLYLEMKNGAFVGFSVPQILERKINLSDADQNNSTTNFIPHYYAMGGYRYQMNDLITLEPSVLIKFTKSNLLQVDASIKALLKNKFWLAGSYRTQDAATAMIGYQITPSIEAAYAYDFTLSTLREGSKGSHEITLAFRFGNKDSDGDGIKDKDDKCPDEPGIEALEGCPEPPVAEDTDWDRDGLRNDIDKCPKVPGVASNQGCPIDDRDKDGIVDAKDKCPDEPGILVMEGCPPEDVDMDGILDIADRCPTVKGTFKNQGCPEEDSDGDGILNYEDQCPNTPGIREKKGCPKVNDSEKAILDLVMQNLYFDTDKYDIKPRAVPFLNNLAELLIKQKDWKLSLSGHADDRGSDAHNFELSKYRAESVLFYLLNRGVEREQLQVEYYGEDLPTVTNVNAESRQMNRRVELKFIWD